jgi:hypothetical protein
MPDLYRSGWHKRLRITRQAVLGLASSRRRVTPALWYRNAHLAIRITDQLVRSHPNPSASPAQHEIGQDRPSAPEIGRSAADADTEAAVRSPAQFCALVCQSKSHCIPRTITPSISEASPVTIPVTPTQPTAVTLQVTLAMTPCARTRHVASTGRADATCRPGRLMAGGLMQAAAVRPGGQRRAPARDDHAVTGERLIKLVPR